MMGDNRYCSKDSRYWGIVPEGQHSRTPAVRVLLVRARRRATTTHVRRQVSDRPLPFISDIRWGRIGHMIR